jgi:3-mercaptopyruvate sulfurtransferase SseA
MAQHLGIRPEQRIVTHCGGGIAAATPFFALKFIAGYPQVSLYPGSQLEWLRDDRSLPFWTYAAPQMLRDMHWVNGWTNRTVRSYGISQVSVVDLRAAEQYGKGHVPYALNVPAALFRQHLDQPAARAPLLSAAGVNPREEAVLVGDGGRLAPDVALAFLVLHQLGQARVSLLAGSADDWGLAGLPVATHPTVVGARRSPDDLVVRPVPYTAELRSGVVVRMRDGALPPDTVIIAAGATPPAKAPPGKLLHVPHSQLLDAAGRPKPAGDLWTVLSKAGVPRYAPIATTADDPGEAAVAWLVLRLMGYADVKVILP